MLGFISFRDYHEDNYPAAVSNDGQKVEITLYVIPNFAQAPIGGSVITYLVTGKATVAASSSPSYTINDGKSIEENFAGSKRQAALDYIQMLLNKGKLDHVRALLPALLDVCVALISSHSFKEHKDDLDFLKLNLSLQSKTLDANKSGMQLPFTVANLVVDENLAAVIKAADQVISHIDAVELATFFGTIHEDSDPAVKPHNEKKEALINALNERALALHAEHLVSFF